MNRKTIKLTSAQLVEKLENQKLFQFELKNRNNHTEIYYLDRKDVNALKRYGVLTEKNGLIENVAKKEFMNIVINASVQIELVSPVKRNIYVVTYSDNNHRRKAAPIYFYDEKVARSYGDNFKNPKVTLVDSYMDYE
jgi:hypothetical protein